MSEKISETREFVRGAARYCDLVYVLSKGKSLVEEDIAHSSLIGIDRGNWGSNVDVDWDATAIAVAKEPLEKLVFVGEEGDVCTYVAGNYTSEIIEPAPILIRNANTIEGRVCACGMRRQVYLRTDENTWEDISAPFSEAGEGMGFEDIDGFSLSEIYAVGWGGEIWRYQGNKWINCDSPTNLILTSVCCAEDDLVYIGGKNGTLLRGRMGSWKLVEWEDDVDIDIWDVCWFDGKLYVATTQNLYTLRGNLLHEVDFGDVEVSSFFNLTAAEGVMWSIGSSDVLSFDGSNWQSY